jgi:hypothetical protein
MKLNQELLQVKKEIQVLRERLKEGDGIGMIE